MKEYFSHDYFSRNDPKLVKLRMDLGFEGIGIYWALVEIMYEQGGHINKSEIESIAFELRLKCERIAKVLQSHDLFYLSDEKYFSESVNKRLNFRLEKSEKARKSANIKWDKVKNQQLDANAMRTLCDGNAIKGKESIKESKVKKTIEERRSEFVSQILALNFDLSDKEIENFISYWTDKNNGDLKMRFELEKKFYFTRRLATWKKNTKTQPNDKSDDMVY